MWTVRKTIPFLYETMQPPTSVGPQVFLMWEVSSELLGKWTSWCFTATWKQTFWTYMNKIIFSLQVNTWSRWIAWILAQSFAPTCQPPLCRLKQSYIRRTKSVTSSTVIYTCKHWHWKLVFKLVNSPIITTLLINFRKIHECILPTDTTM